MMPESQQASHFMTGGALVNSKFSPPGSECEKPQFGLAQGSYQECIFS